MDPYRQSFPEDNYPPQYSQPIPPYPTNPEYRRPVKIKVVWLLTIAISITISVSVSFYIWGTRTGPITNPAPVTTSPSFASGCPTALQAAQAVGDDPNHVRENGEFCAFKLADGAPRTIHCPTGLGKASLEASLATGQEGVYIIECDGVTPTRYAIYGATLRFENWEPDGDACTVHSKDPSAPVIGTTCP